MSHTSIPVEIESARRHLFDLVVLDTNALRAMGVTLSASWFERLREICNRVAMPIAVTQVSIDEWTEHCVSQLRIARSRAIETINLFAILTASRCELSSDLSFDKPTVAKNLQSILLSQGVIVLPTVTKAVDRYLDEAVTKEAPFETGGKGFVDAIIIDSVIAYAQSLSYRRVLLVSADRAVQSAEKRFADAGLQVQFASAEASHEAAAEALSAADAEFLRQRQARLLECVQQFEDPILGSLRSKPIDVSHWSLYDALREAKLESWLPHRIIQITPVRIATASVAFGIPEEIAGKNRYRMDVGVECDIELQVRSSNHGANLLFVTTTVSPQENVPGGVPVKTPLVSGTDKLNVVRVLINVVVEGSILRESFDLGICEDFRIEPELTPVQWQALRDYWSELRDSEEKEKGAKDNDGESDE